jgi:major membrane immunogen (membrane-anchored lipoprotein)
MKRSGPVVTLLAGLLLGLFMLSMNSTTGTRSASTSYAEESPEAATASPAPIRTTASPSPSPSRTPIPDADYAGRTTDDSASVAVTLRDGKAVAYFCDGRAKESWLKGDVEDDGTMKLTGKHGAKLNGTLKEGKRISGSVDIDGGQYAFTADKAKKPSGLYRATATVRGAKVDGGWIVLPDGRQVGILTRDGEPSPAPRIDPETGAVTVDGQQLTARPVTP